MLSKKLNIVIFWSSLLSVVIGCDSGAEYRQLVKSQLESGNVNDTIFQGIYFGMNYDQYYNHITELGHQGRVSQGRRMNVRCEIEGFNSKIRMEYVPEYINDSIQLMKVSYSYVSWSPWNKRTTDDHLWNEVLQLYTNKYGLNFIELQSNISTKPAMVWVLGNQQITLFQKEMAKVNVIFKNLRKTKIPY